MTQAKSFTQVKSFLTRTADFAQDITQLSQIAASHAASGKVPVVISGDRPGDAATLHTLHAIWRIESLLMEMNQRQEKMLGEMIAASTAIQNRKNG